MLVLVLVLVSVDTVVEVVATVVAVAVNPDGAESSTDKVKLVEAGGGDAEKVAATMPEASVEDAGGAGVSWMRSIRNVLPSAPSRS